MESEIFFRRDRFFGSDPASGRQVGKLILEKIGRDGDGEIRIFPEIKPAEIMNLP